VNLSPVRRGALAASCCAVLFLYAVYLGALGVLLPVIGDSFALGANVSGRLFPATFGGFVVGVLVCGYLSDRAGRKRVLLLGIGAYAAGLALFGGAPSFDLALLAGVLIGAGSGAMETVASALAADLYPHRRAFILNVLQIAFGAGAALSPLAAQVLLRGGTDWRLLYFGLCGASAVLFLAFVAQRAPVPAGAAEVVDPAALRTVLRQQPFLLLCLAQAFYVGAELGFFSWMPTYLRREVPGGAAWEGRVVAVFWVAMTVGRIAVAGFSGRMPLPRLITFLASGAAILSALALVWPAPLPVITFVAATGLCFSGIFSLILAEAGERYGQFAGTVFGGVMAVGGVGGACFPWVIGVLAETSVGWRGGLVLVPVLAAGIAALMPLLARPRR
jgi:FHS family glucose/mannose:H+ symporter-like MFS transporter